MLVRAAAEFGSRLIYDDEELVISRAPDVEKTGNSVEARLDLGGSQVLTGSARYAKSRRRVMRALSALTARSKVR